LDPAVIHAKFRIGFYWPKLLSSSLAKGMGIAGTCDAEQGRGWLSIQDQMGTCSCRWTALRKFSGYATNLSSAFVLKLF
jgi:hypothetical protein